MLICLLLFGIFIDTNKEIHVLLLFSFLCLSISITFMSCFMENLTMDRISQPNTTFKLVEIDTFGIRHYKIITTVKAEKEK